MDEVGLGIYRTYRDLYNRFLVRMDLMGPGDIVEFLGEPAVVIESGDDGRLTIEHVDGRVRRVEPVDIVNLSLLELLTAEVSS
jgi:hypothetical protein